VTTPLSMIVLGSMIAELPVRELFTERKLFLLSAFRLLLFPALGFLVARLFFSDAMLVGVIAVTLGMPAGTMCAMVSRQYGSAAQADTAAKGVFLTTALSVITLPLMMFLMAHS
jgi:malate permease and related proteins